MNILFVFGQNKRRLRKKDKEMIEYYLKKVKLVRRIESVCGSSVMAETKGKKKKKNGGENFQYKRQ
jgi:hypothetical protein